MTLDRPTRLIEIFDGILNETHDSFCDINLPIATQTLSDLINSKQADIIPEKKELYEGFMLMYEAFRPLAKFESNSNRVENLLKQKKKLDAREKMRTTTLPTPKNSM